jgi:hypothetical protein
MMCINKHGSGSQFNAYQRHMKNTATHLSSHPNWSYLSPSFSIIVLLLLLSELSNAIAANLLTNPGFEAGQTGWSNPNLVRGGTSLVITDPTLAHTGNNCISNYNPSGWSSAEQGDATGGWSTGVSLPVSPANYYKLSAWVKVPGASTNAQAMSLRYRFEPSGNRVDVGTKTITTENWTLLETGWIQPGANDTFMSYWEVHSMNNGVVFFADDCGLEESPALMLEGKVLNANGVAVDGAAVNASSPGYTAPATTTVGGGVYSLGVPAGTYKIGASIPGFKGSVNVTVSSSPTTAPDIRLATDPDYDPDLIFSAKSTDIVAGAPWPAVNPAGASLTVMGTPGVQSFGGVQWEKNVADGPGYRFATFSDSIPVTGASIVVAAKPKRMPSNNWDSIVDVFYNRLVLGIRNDTGLVNVWRNGDQAFSTTAIPEGQVTVLSLVVQPTGEYKVWANGVEVMNIATASDMTLLVPNVPGGYANAINVGRNDPDGWTTFNGNIGDVYLFKTVITDAKRLALEASLLSKFVTNATLSYTITASVGANGTVSSPGTTSVVQGYDKTYALTANAGYVVEKVLVDGVSVGATASYTFTEVNANHTISATFVSLPPQTITASAGANGTISPSGSVSVPAGADQTFAIHPDTGYAVADVLVDGVSKGEIYSYTFPFVIAPHTIAVTFRALNMPVPRADQIIFSAVANVLPGNGSATGPWPTYIPAGKTLTVYGAPTSAVGVGGVGTAIWESNARATSDGYRFPGGTGNGGEYLGSIPCSGASIVVAAAPSTGGAADAWNSIVDVFYDRLTLGIRNDTGAVYARVNGTPATSTTLIPSLQPTILSMVVQPDGNYKVWENGREVLTGSGSALTSLDPGAEPFKHYINLGRNDPDGWTAFNGNIGDVFLYKSALSDAERDTLQNAMASKFGIVLPVFVSLSGKVTLADGATPVAGATVTAAGAETFTGVTAADGTYSIRVAGGASPVAYSVSATKASYTTSTAQSVNVSTTGVVGVDLRISLINAIQGYVKKADGSPIPNAVVQVGDAGPATITGPDGKYLVTSITVGAGIPFYADALGYADHNETIDTSAAGNGVITKADVVLTPKAETDYTYIQNGGFENGLFGWGKDGTPIVGVTNTPVASGGASGYWQSTEANWYAGYLRQVVPVVEGSTYNIYFKLNTAASVGQCGFDFLSQTGDSLMWWGYAGGLRPGENWMYTTVPNVWEQALDFRNWDNSMPLTCVRVTPPAGTVSIQLIFGLGASAVGQVLYVDDVVVDRVGPAAPPLTPVMTMANGVPGFKFQTLTNHKYRMVYKNSLNDANWAVIPGTDWVQGSGAETEILDNNTLPAARYYRLEIQ